MFPTFANNSCGLTQMIRINALMFLLVAAQSVTAENFEAERARNWHQWRGPDANGVASQGDPPIQWDATTNVKWKVPLQGHGSSTPIVWGDTLFVTSAVRTDRISDAPTPDRQPPEVKIEGVPPLTIEPVPTHYHQFLVSAFERSTGKELWKKVVAEEVPHRAHHLDHGYASSSPTTDGKRLYVSFGSVGLFCLDFDGELIWKRDLGDMEVANDFGEVVTPVLYGDRLVAVMDHLGQSFIEALSTTTGKTVWKKERVELASWSTPLVAEYAGKVQVIVCGGDRVISYGLASGDTIWECGGLGKAIVASPIQVGELVYCMTGHLGDSLLAIRLDSTGDATDTKQVAWRTNKATSYVPSPIAYNEQLYFLRRSSGILSGLHAKTGKRVFGPTRLKLDGSVYASPVASAGRLYFVARDGTTLVIRHGDHLEVLATNRLDESIDASPVIVGNDLFLRGSKNLYCLSEK